MIKYRVKMNYPNGKHVLDKQEWNIPECDDIRQGKCVSQDKPDGYTYIYTETDGNSLLIGTAEEFEDIRSSIAKSYSDDVMNALIYAVAKHAIDHAVLVDKYLNI